MLKYSPLVKLANVSRGVCNSSVHKDFTLINRSRNTSSYFSVIFYELFEKKTELKNNEN